MAGAAWMCGDEVTCRVISASLGHDLNSGVLPKDNRALSEVWSIDGVVADAGP